MKINLNMAEVRTAVCEYLKNELSINNISADDVVFQNARSIEDMGFEIHLHPKTAKTIPEVLKETKNETHIRESKPVDSSSKAQSNEESLDISPRKETEVIEAEVRDPDAEPGNPFSSVFGSLKN